MMKKLIWLGVASIALFAVTATVRAQDVGFEKIFETVSVDLKVNGQDGPVKIEKGSRIVLSWISEDATRCRGNWSKNDIKTSGTVAGRISKSVIVKVACINNDGDRDDDSVVVNVSGGAVINQPGNVGAGNVGTVTTPTTTAQPSISYVQAKAANVNEIYSGELAYIYGSGFPTDATVSVVVGGVTVAGKTNASGTRITFTAPVMDAFQYKLYVQIDKGVNSNVIGVTLLSTPTTTAQPSISYVSPTSGKAKDNIRLFGVNLVDTVPSGIRVEFLQGGVVKGTVTSNYIYLRSEQVTDPSGKSLTFELPGLLTENIGGGTYQIRVANDKGTSNTVDFTLTTPTTTTSGNVGSGNVGAGNVGTSITTYPSFVTTDRQRAIADLYRELLKREADEGGLRYWDGTDYSLDVVRTNLMKSAEYQSLQKSSSNAGSSFAGAGVPDSDVWNFLKAFFGR